MYAYWEMISVRTCFKDFLAKAVETRNTDCKGSSLKGLEELKAWGRIRTNSAFSALLNSDL